MLLLNVVAIVRVNVIVLAGECFWLMSLFLNVVVVECFYCCCC